jgi:hypothetical protein
MNGIDSFQGLRLAVPARPMPSFSLDGCPTRNSIAKVAESSVLTYILRKYDIYGNGPDTVVHCLRAESFDAVVQNSRVLQLACLCRTHRPERQRTRPRNAEALPQQTTGTPAIRCWITTACSYLFPISSDTRGFSLQLLHCTLCDGIRNIARGSISFPACWMHLMVWPRESFVKVSAPSLSFKSVLTFFSQRANSALFWTW